MQAAAPADADAASTPVELEAGFSPLRAMAAKAGRRAAGRHVTLMEAAPAAASSQPEEPEGRRLSSTDSLRRRAGQQQAPAPAPGPAAPPVKRMGFSLQGGTSDSPDGPSSTSTNSQQPGGFAGVSRRKQEQLQRKEQSQVQQRNKYDEKTVDAQLVDVPELEEAGKEDITRCVARAPKASAPAITSMADLKLDAAWLPQSQHVQQGGGGSGGGGGADINLSLLTACLLPSAQVVEPPDEWDYTLLFSQLKAELMSSQGGDGHVVSGSATAARARDGSAAGE